MKKTLILLAIVSFMTAVTALFSWNMARRAEIRWPGSWGLAHSLTWSFAMGIVLVVVISDRRSEK